jgi:TRAM domain
MAVCLCRPACAGSVGGYVWLKLQSPRQHGWVGTNPCAAAQGTILLWLQDDVPEAVKSARLQEVIATYRAELADSMAAEVGRTHLVRCAHGTSLGHGFQMHMLLATVTIDWAAVTPMAKPKSLQKLSLQLIVNVVLQVLVEGPSKRDASSLTGRTDTMKRVVFPDVPMAAAYSIGDGSGSAGAPLLQAQPGDYVAVEVRDCWTVSTIYPHRSEHQRPEAADYPENDCTLPAFVCYHVVIEPAASLRCRWLCRQVSAASAGTLTAVPLGRTSLRDFVTVHGSAAPLPTAASLGDAALQRLRAVG